jgi:hypothetical protein
MWVFHPTKYPYFVPTGLWKIRISPATHIAPLAGLPLREKKESQSTLWLAGLFDTVDRFFWQFFIMFNPQYFYLFFILKNPKQSLERPFPFLNLQ